MTREIRIGNKLVGDGHPAYIIAEAGINHNGDLENAKKLIDAAKHAGVDAVKFQKRTP
ncbi:MAG: N-acetylneuraminate synthase family protein, partial [Anaerolineaceae bacterium]